MTDSPSQRGQLVPLVVKLLHASPHRRKQPWEEHCPVYGADIYEEGGTGCCNALVAECEGSVDGVPVDWSVADDLCGAGGAEVLFDDPATRIAWHAWEDGKPLTKREPWVGTLRWSSANRPYLA